MDMRLLSQLFLVLAITTITCDQGANQTGARVYDHVLFVRQGGGDKMFTIEPVQPPDIISIAVSRYQFRDTLVQFHCSRDGSTSDLFDALFQTLNGGIEIKGDFRQPTVPTGTWAFLYVVRNGEQLEITNTDLRNRLLPFERLVESYFPPPK